VRTAGKAKAFPHAIATFLELRWNPELVLNEQANQDWEGAVMENKSSNGWKFFALFFGALLAAVVGLYIYKQQNPDYDPWEEPWENSSSPVDLGLTKDADKGDADEAEAAPEAA
jgi:hypothetical protein